MFLLQCNFGASLLFANLTSSSCPSKFLPGPEQTSSTSRWSVVSAPVKALPTFFVVGAPKAGTTSLYHYLDQHPDIYMCPIKEPNYFATDIRPENFSEELQERVNQDLHVLREYLRGPMSEKRFGGLVSEWDDYLRLFQNVRKEKAVGEASVCYLWSRTAAANIRSRIPDAKIIMILRNPAERAFSQYLQSLASGLVRNSFREEIQASLLCKSDKFSLRHPFLDLGLYHEQVKRYLELFPRENICVQFYEEYKRQQTQMLVDMLRFLNVDPTFRPNILRRYLEPQVPRFIAISYYLRKYGVWQRVADLSPHLLRSLFRPLVVERRQSIVIDRKDREYLVDYYKEDIRQLSTLLDRDLDVWLH